MEFFRNNIIPKIKLNLQLFLWSDFSVYTQNLVGCVKVNPTVIETLDWKINALLEVLFFHYKLSFANHFRQAKQRPSLSQKKLTNNWKKYIFPSRFAWKSLLSFSLANDDVYHTLMTFQKQTEKSNWKQKHNFGGSTRVEVTQKSKTFKISRFVFTLKNIWNQKIANQDLLNLESFFLSWSKLLNHKMSNFEKCYITLRYLFDLMLLTKHHH